MAGMLIQVVLLIVNSGAGFLSVLLLLRFFMQAWRVPFNHPIGGFVLTLTSWLVLPLRKILPPVFGFDSASLVAAYLLQALLLGVTISLYPGLAAPDLTQLLVLVLVRSLLATLRLVGYMIIGLLIVQAVLSWFAPYSPLYRPLSQMTDPVLRPLRRIVPPVSGIDLTPLIALLLAQIVLIFL